MGFFASSVDAPPPLAIEGSRKRNHCSDALVESKESEISKAPPKKRVRFATTLSGEIKQTEFPSSVCLADLNKRALWWRKDEREEISDRCREIYQDFRIHHMDQVRRYLYIYELCSKAPSETSNEYLGRATLVIPDDIRGLEWGVMPSIKECRKTHVQDVLDVQEQLQGCLSEDVRCRILSTRSARSSRPSRVLARLVGEGDAVRKCEPTPVRRRKMKMMSTYRTF